MLFCKAQGQLGMSPGLCTLFPGLVCKAQGQLGMSPGLCTQFPGLVL